jgi:excinuclease ABC subunit A
MNVSEAIEFFRGEPKIQERLAVLTEVGLDYIQLGQTSSTLSAGEAQRLKLANYLVQSSNRRALIIMDEPTTGLHFYDVEKLIQCMQKLIDAGNSLIVVEHNEQILNAADWIIDIGPGAAEQGGSIVAEGTPDQVAQSQESKTATYLVK